jgi:hypothetical protein
MSANGNGTPAVATLSDDLIARAQAIASRSDELLRLLEDSRQRLLKPNQKPSAARRFEPAAEQKSPTEKPAPKDEISDGLRLLTTQMSVAGSSREQIAARLRDEFEINDPETILRDMGL